MSFFYIRHWLRTQNDDEGWGTRSLKRSKEKTTLPMDTMPQLSSSKPQECHEDEGAPSEEEEFNEFCEFPSNADDSLGSPWESGFKAFSTLRQDSSQSLPSINQPVEQTQPTSTVSLMAIDDQATDEVGISEKSSVLKSCLLTNETDFADFSVFGEQAAQAWCCGLGGAEFWDAEEIPGQKGLSITSGEVAILDSEPKSSACIPNDDIFTNVYHCEKQTKLSQDFQNSPHFQLEWSHFVHKSIGKCCESHKEKKHSFNLNFLRTSKETGQREEREKKEKSVSTLSQTASSYDFKDNVSSDDCSSQDEPSEDFEPNVSSLASQEDTDTDQDQTDDEEELRNYRLSRSFCSDYIWYSPQTSNLDVDTGLFYKDHSATQESSATSVDSEYKSHSEEEQMFRCVSLEASISQLQSAEGEVQGCLPPSDSFADFCSAPSQEEKDCELFQDQQEAFVQQCDITSCQTVLHCQVQQLFLDSFPQLVSTEEVEDSISGLDALLVVKYQNDHEEKTRHSGLLCTPPGLRGSSQDIFSAAGLQFQWAGSHINRCLHQCLGVDSKNILFIGIKKQSVVVPASYQGLLEPIKDSLSAVYFPGQTAVTTHAPMKT